MTEASPITWLLAGGVIFALSLAAWSEARLAARVIGQFFVTIALPVLLAVGALLALLSPLAPAFDPRVSQALIAGLVIAVGWLTTVIFAELAKRRTRAERLRDYHKAIYAEIGYTLNSLWDLGRSSEDAQSILDQMAADADFVPFIPRETFDHVYDAVVGDIDVLPRQTIDAIVAFYGQIKSISALAEDMRGDGFRALPQPRRAAMYRDYMEMREQAYLSGLYTLKLIKAFSDGGAGRAQAIINTQAEDRSARSGDTA